jgi:anti-sigma regulatory factor (Ser/Thr protein kinase)
MHPIRQVLRFPATSAGLRQAADDIRRTLDASDLPARTRYNLELIFDEIVANIIRHAGVAPAAEIEAEVELAAHEAILTVEDGGAPFDPRQHPEPEPRRSLDDTRVGGFGLMLVRKAAGHIDYQRTEQQRNRLTVRIPRT